MTTEEGGREGSFSPSGCYLRTWLDFLPQQRERETRRMHRTSPFIQGTARSGGGDKGKYANARDGINMQMRNGEREGEQEPAEREPASHARNGGVMKSLPSHFWLNRQSMQRFCNEFSGAMHARESSTVAEKVRRSLPSTSPSRMERIEPLWIKEPAQRSNTSCSSWSMQVGR